MPIIMSRANPNPLSRPCVNDTITPRMTPTTNKTKKHPSPSSILPTPIYSKPAQLQAFENYTPDIEKES